jgi:serine/threonine protein kinase
LEFGARLSLRFSLKSLLTTQCFLLAQVNLNSPHSQSPDPIIHTDLKLGNILLDSDYDAKIAKIADFGLSKIKTGSYAGSNAVCGIMLMEVLFNHFN